MTPASLKARSWVRRALPVALATAAFAAAGCGGDSGGGRLLSQQQARELRATLTEIEQDVSAGNCTGAGQQVSAIEEQIDSIRRLDSKLRSALRASTRRLDTLVTADCGTTTETTPTQTTTTPQEGATGTTGTTGEQGKKPKKPKKEKKVPPGQGGTPPGQDEQTPSDQGGQGGGAAAPGEGSADGGTP
jgi:hypothetical protein